MARRAARPERILDEALVLRARDWSETSQVATFLVRGRGKVQLVAKGSRRPAPRFDAPIEPLVRAKVRYVERSKESLRDLHAFEPIDLYFALRRDLDRTFCATYVVELLDGLAPHEQPVPELYDAAVAALADLDRGADPALCVIAFEIAALALSGFELGLLACCECGSPLPAEGAPDAPRPDEPVAFAPWQGGIVCPRCQAGVRGASRVPARAIRALAALAAGRLPAKHPPPVLVNEMRAALDTVMASTLEHRPRLAAYLAGRRPPFGRRGVGDQRSAIRPPGREATRTKEAHPKSSASTRSNEGT